MVRVGFNNNNPLSLFSAFYLFCLSKHPLFACGTGPSKGITEMEGALYQDVQWPLKQLSNHLVPSRGAVGVTGLEILNGQLGGFVDKGMTKQFSAQPPSCSSPGEIQAHVRMEKWLNMGLSDQISHQSSTLGDSFSHQNTHFWILITYTSVVLHILVNFGTVCLGVVVGVLVEFCCSWGVFFVCVFLCLIFCLFLVRVFFGRFFFFIAAC